MSGSWNAGDVLKARINACKGEFRPVVYKLRVDDTHAQWRFEMAARALWGQSLQSFFLYCAEYVLQHHRQLADTRFTIRQREKEQRRQKRDRERAEKAARRAALKAARRAAHE